MIVSRDKDRDGPSSGGGDAAGQAGRGRTRRRPRYDAHYRQPGSQIVGILNIDKPKGPTSHDVVARIRRLSGQRRVGHAGTLDPMATGVLVVCLGKATRLVEYITDSSKSYLATIHFGVTTDTWDVEGEIVQNRDCSSLSLKVVERALARFRGTIEQVPPMYSALKHDGQPLYRLAWQGMTVERKPRQVEISRAQIMDWRPPELVLEIDCSKGTYIRSLAHDLGQAVGSGAHLSDLRRLAVGHFRLEHAVSLTSLLEEDAGDWCKRHLLPMGAAVKHMPSVTVDMDTARRISYGQGVPLTVPEGVQVCCAYMVQAVGEGRELLAVLRRDQEAGLWRPQKVLAAV